MKLACNLDAILFMRASMRPAGKRIAKRKHSFQRKVRQFEIMRTEIELGPELCDKALIDFEIVSDNSQLRPC